MMTYEEKVRFLKSYRIAKENAETYLRQINDLRETMLPSGIHYTDMPKHPNYDDQMANYAGEFWELQKKLEKAQKKQLQVIAVINQIAEDDPLGHRILTERYIYGTRAEGVCAACYIARKTEYRHRRKAIERLKI